MPRALSAPTLLDSRDRHLQLPVLCCTVMQWDLILLLPLLLHLLSLSLAQAYTAVEGTESPVSSSVWSLCNRRLVVVILASVWSEIRLDFWDFSQQLVFQASVNILQFLWLGYDTGVQFSHYCISHGSPFGVRHVSSEDQLDYFKMLCAVGGLCLYISKSL